MPQAVRLLDEPQLLRAMGAAALKTGANEEKVSLKLAAPAIGAGGEDASKSEAMLAQERNDLARLCLVLVELDERALNENLVDRPKRGPRASEYI